jgi:hypothetical protein
LTKYLSCHVVSYVRHTITTRHTYPHHHHCSRCLPSQVCNASYSLFFFPLSFLFSLIFLSLLKWKERESISASRIKRGLEVLDANAWNMFGRTNRKPNWKSQMAEFDGLYTSKAQHGSNEGLVAAAAVTISVNN